MSRIETGVLAINDDWPGVFIRGDDAAYYAACTRHLLDLAPLSDPFVRSALSSLADLLESSRVGKATPQHIQTQEPSNDS